MDADDDDLSALRSAALASLSKKAPKHETKEEDLTALRQAALMTRKQKQIEVIQRPAPQKNAFPNWLDPRLHVPPHIPIGSLPPPQNVNVTVIRQANIRPPVPYMPQRPLASFPHPQIPWATSNLINLTPGPTPPIPPPLMGNIQGLRFVNMPPRQLPPRSVATQRGPLNQNIIVPKQTRFSGHRNRLPREVRPVRHTVAKVQTVPPVNPTQNSEPKVSDKFSRYDPDSSSDDDDDDHTAAQESHKDESDAESVASNKSFSSVSEPGDNAERNVDKEDERDKSSEEETRSSNGTPDLEEDVTIVNEEEGILAAIDEFLDEGLDPLPAPKVAIKPPKTVPQMKKSKPVTASKPTKKDQNTKPSKKPSKVESTQPATDTLPQKGIKKPKRAASKNIKPITAPAPIQAPVAKSVKTSTKTSNKTSKSEPVKAEGRTVSEKNSGHVSKTKMGVKKEPLLLNKENPEPVRVKSRPRKSDIPETDEPIHMKRDSRNSDAQDQYATSRNSTKAKNPARVQKRDPPVQQRAKVMVSETRQRHDSDLDSVGSSDLSFLSSSESEAEPEKPASVELRESEKQGAKMVQRGENTGNKRKIDAPERGQQNRIKGQIDLRASGRDGPNNVEKRRPLGGIKERIGVRERDLTAVQHDERRTDRVDLKENQLDDSANDLRKTQKVKSIDLRQKLKRDTSENIDESQKPKSLDLRERLKRRKNLGSEVTGEKTKQSSNVRKHSPVAEKSERVSMTTGKKSTIIKLSSDSKSRQFLSQGRNIVITRKRTPSPVFDEPSTSPEPVRTQNVKKQPRTRKRSISTRSTDVKLRKITDAEQSKKPAPVKTNRSHKKSSEYLESIKHENVESSKVKPRKLSTKREKIQQQTLGEQTPSESSESEAAVDDVDILDIHEYDDMLFDLEGNFELEMPQKTTPKSRRKSSDTRPRKVSTSSPSESESDGEIIEETTPEREYEKQNFRSKPTSKKTSDRYRKPMRVESSSDGEIVEEYQYQPRLKVEKKPRVDHKSHMKKTTGSRRKSIQMDGYTDSESEGEILEDEKFETNRRAGQKQIINRRMGMKKVLEFRQKSDKFEDFEKRPPSRSRPVETSAKSRRVLISSKSVQESKKDSAKRNFKRKSPDFDSDKPSKKSLKKRLGSRVVISDESFADSHSRQLKEFNIESDDDDRNSTKARKIVKTKRKKSSANKDDRLEARIQRIKKQNGRILQRQMEIEHEKKKFG